MRLYWTDFKPFWAELDNNFLRQNIEEYLTENGYEWNLFSENKFQWTDDGIELITEKNNINYLKLISDDNVIFYYYKVNIPMANLTYSLRKYIYKIDMYNTIFREIFLFFESKNIPVFTLKAFLNRFDMKKNGLIVSANYNLTKMKYMNQIIPKNYSYVKRYLTSTTPEEMSDINGCRNEYEFIDYTTGSKYFTVSLDDLNKPNKNNKFTYMKAASSSFIANLDTTKEALTGAEMITDYDFLFLIPNFIHVNMTDYYDPDLFYKYIYPSVTQLENLDIDFLNPAGSNFISIYDRDIPYSVVCEKFINNLRTVTIRLFARSDGYDDRIDKSYQSNYIIIPFILLPLNTAIDITLFQYKQLNNSIFGKMIYAIQNIDKWRPNTDPFMFNPFFYREEILIDSEKKLTLDAGLIDFYIEDIFNVKEINYNLNARIIFDQTGILIYDFGNNTNRLNVWWNNYFSNCRFEDSSQIGYKTAALSNYASDNIAMLYTAHNNLKDTLAHRKTGQIMDLVDTWGNFAFDSMTSQANTAANAIAMINPFNIATGKSAQQAAGVFSGLVDVVQKPFNTILDTVRIVKNNQYQSKIDLRNYSENVKNIQSAANSPVSTPFLSSYYKNEIRDNNYLFAVWSSDLHNVDKLNIFNDLLSSGYFINTFLSLSELRNRKYMNYYLIDWTKNKNYLWKIFQDFKFNDYFNNNYWFELFITYFNNVKIWEQNIINCENLGYIEDNDNIIINSDYVDNYENVLDLYFNSFLKNTVLNDLDLTPYHFNNKPLNISINFLKTLTTFTDWDYVSIEFNKNYVKFTGDGEHYGGTIIKNSAYDGDITESAFYDIILNDATGWLKSSDYNNSNWFDFYLLDDVSIKNFLKTLFLKRNERLWNNIESYLTIDDYLIHDDFNLNFAANFINYEITNNITTFFTDQTYFWTVNFKLSVDVNTNDFTKETYIFNSKVLKRVIFTPFWFREKSLQGIFNNGLFEENIPAPQFLIYPNFKIWAAGDDLFFSIVTHDDKTIDVFFNHHYTGPGEVAELSFNNFRNIGQYVKISTSDITYYNYAVKISDTYKLNLIRQRFIEKFEFKLSLGAGIKSKLTQNYIDRYEEINYYIQFSGWLTSMINR